MESLIIIGAGGFGRECLQLIRDIQQIYRVDIQVDGFIDAAQQGQEIGGVRVLGDDEWAIKNLNPATRFVIAIGKPARREKIARKFEGAGFNPYTLIHPSVTLSDSVQTGRGCILCAGVRMTVNIRIGCYSILNLNCTVGHDTVIGDFNTLAPAVNLSGNVRLGYAAEAGTGAVVLPGIQLGDQCVLGAGAVATKNLEGPGTYVGVPARLAGQR